MMRNTNSIGARVALCTARRKNCFFFVSKRTLMKTTRGESSTKWRTGSYPLMLIIGGIRLLLYLCRTRDMHDMVTIFRSLHPKCTTVSPFTPHAVCRFADVPLSPHQTHTCMTSPENGFTTVPSPHGYTPHAEAKQHEGNPIPALGPSRLPPVGAQNDGTCCLRMTTFDTNTIDRAEICAILFTRKTYDTRGIHVTSERNARN